MDPVSLTIGTLGLPGQIFSSSVAAYTTISQVQGMGRMFGRYFAQFKIQESRYIFWGTYHKACNPEGLNANSMPQVIFETIVNTLIQINSLLEDRTSLVAKYGLQEVGSLAIIEGDLIRRESARQQNAVKKLQKRASLLRKIQWAVRDEKLFLELVQQLTNLIDVLYECLPVQSGSYIGDSIRADAISEMILSKTHPILEQNENIDNGRPDSEGQALSSMQTAIVAAENRERFYGDQVIPNDSIHLPLPFDAFRYLEFTSTRQVSNDAPHSRSWARLRSDNALAGQDFLVVEWRIYDALRTDQKSLLRIRIQALVHMLKSKPKSDSFRVLDCVGFFEDNTSTRFGVTYRVPTGMDLTRGCTPYNLREAINGKQTQLPYLGDRFRLAYILAESLHALHTTGWLHKSICATNVLFFPATTSHTTSNNERRTSLDNPYFTGFALSRPDDQAETLSLGLNSKSVDEMSLYRHPAYKHGTKYRSIFDIYSLGIILMELGTWRVASFWLPQLEKRFPGMGFREYILNNVVPGLGASMGERYMNVVRKCLLGTFEGLEGYQEHEFDSLGYKDNVRAGLLWEVVSVLRDCRA